jgi:uncharacterized hydrophobic protein (TIGR00271 family)
MKNNEDFVGVLRLGRWLRTSRQIIAPWLALVLGLTLLIIEFFMPAATQRLPGVELLVAVVLGFSLLSILELLGGSSELGGTYLLTQETLGGVLGFMSGWGLLLGSAAFSATMIIAAAQLVTDVVPLGSFPAILVPTVITLVIIVGQIFQLTPRRLPLWLVTFGLGLLWALLFIFQPQLVRLGSDPSTSLTLTSIRLTIAYLGIEAVMTMRGQISRVTKALPRSLKHGFVASMAVLLLLILVVVWNPGGDQPSMDGQLEQWFRVGADSVTLLVFLIAASVGFRIGVGQLHDMSRVGALPNLSRPLWRRAPIPLLLYLVIIALTLPIATWMPMEIGLDLAAGLVLVVVIILNITAIYSGMTEPERRRTLVVPFRPVVPLISIAICFVLIFSIDSAPLIWSGGWLAAGMMFYLAYARQRQVAAQEGVVVFGRPRRREEDDEYEYRILVPIGQKDERRLILRMGVALARQLHAELVPLQVIPISDPLAVEEGRRIAGERNRLFGWSTRFATESDVPVFPITRLARSVRDGILDTAVEEGCDLILLSWGETEINRQGRMGSTLEPVIQNAPCDVAVIAYDLDQTHILPEPAPETPQEDEERHIHILVSSAGGPHAPLATELALLLASEFSGSITVVYVLDHDATPEEVAEGEARLEATLDRVRQLARELPVEVKLDRIEFNREVVKAESVVDGIIEASNSQDLVFVGASEESIIDQILFGNIAREIAAACTRPVVMVKHFRGLPRFWLQRFWNTLYAALPTLTGQEQLDIYKEVRRGARPDVDFFVMMGLSATIATLGLMQGSTAVIIGSMLVAPLFSPILALSLGIAQGDIRMMRVAIESTIKGVVLAIGMAFLVASLSPLKVVTYEIELRTAPNLFDLAIALAAGAAGAYAVARKDVSTSLPGVAIAAALVPPLGVAGYGLAVRDIQIAGGGSLLVFTNLIAITLCGSIVLLLLGFRPTRRRERAARLRMGLLATSLMLLVIAVPLGLVFVDTIQESSTMRRIEQSVQNSLAEYDSVEVINIDFERQQDNLLVMLTIESPSETDDSIGELVLQALAEDLGTQVRLEVTTIQVDREEFQ